ncbi:hypothetical protein SINU_05110 [Sporolactobacillus inulinus CASD]|uniref:Glycosyl transferase family 1 domain-containing protein n=1 Tax=Sporolactobacillus inulinus CASD TaxID=1069536 RepID=A0A0U1QQG5_9BACL|nr:hypothetical protein SINU_05110 [Sporolactobacillus inulinus CASD]
MKNINQKSDNYRAELFLMGGTEDQNWVQDLPYTSCVPAKKNKLLQQLEKFSSILQYLKKEKPSMVISVDTKLIRVCQLCRHFIKPKFPIVSWIHFSLFNEPLVNTKLLPYADNHLCISSGIAKQMKSLGIHHSNLYVIYNPISYIEKIVPRPQGTTKFIYIGRVQMERQKRLQDLLTALSQVDGNWHLDVYGDGEDADSCKRLSEKLGIYDQITWHGWVDNAWKSIHEATALLLTSAYEGLPMVLAEAISRGVYCISSDCQTGPEDLIQDGINGELYQPGNLKQLQSILQSVVTGKELPDQRSMKESIQFMYANSYYAHLQRDFARILDKWNAK